MAKAIIIKCTIGKLDISNDAIDNLRVERNFSDVSNKFSMSLVDSPVVNALFTDIELYMCAGGRSISFRYGDSMENLESFSGTIWDYRVTFVGNIKKLEISGYVTPSMYVQNVSGLSYSYNIDWNSYYNLRADNTKMWNVLRQLDRAHGLSKKYNNFQSQVSNKEIVTEYDGLFPVYGEYQGSAVDNVQSSDILDDFFHSLYTFNTTYIPVKGPVGTINLPVPTSFVSSTSTSIVGEDKDSGVTVNFEKQAVYRFYDSPDVIYKHYDYNDHSWHVDSPDSLSGNRVYYIFPSREPERIVGFKAEEGTYVEVNLVKDYAGAGILLYNSNGVSPSDIVRQLAILEGWEIGNIVETETVPCGDTFKMHNQSALQFIIDNLVPVSILPVGLVKDKSGASVTITSGKGGFYPYFKDGKFYYEPLSINQLADVTNSLLLGYNIPNSPVMSFQIDTKGTVFYTIQNVKMNAVSLVSGKEVEEVAVTSAAQINEYNKVSGFNEGLASFFGYSYEEAKNKGFDIVPHGHGKNVILEGETDPYRTDDTPFTLTSPQFYINSDFYDDRLVTNLAVSSVSSDYEVIGSLEAAKRRISDYMIKASMTLWGDIRLKPATLVRVVNMIKSSSSIYPTQHFSSGIYMIQSQTDEISGSGFIQTLNLLRYSDGVKGSLSEFQDIDWRSSKILPLTANLSFTTDNVDNNTRLAPRGYSVLSNTKYKGHDVYSDGSNIVIIPDLNLKLNINDLVSDTSKSTQKFLADLAIEEDIGPAAPKGYKEVTTGFYCKGKNIKSSLYFYTPYYGGMYFVLSDDETLWGKDTTKVPSQYHPQFYVNGTSGKFYIDGLYGDPKKEYFWLVGLGILRRSSGDD